ncbi:response regulator [Zoogloea sp. LCSB751]|uniref:Hpt domain-containing response regulator n=1 Tax=Zoogloea sp. LCSB751 TaxID=1965277 RepID=UPI0009A49252|nr:response regulator [Zoogloea sp. LCSB751]
MNETTQDISPTPRLTGITVLAAEDDEINQIVLDDVLSYEGARVEIVGNGRTAVERITTAAPDAFQLVLMDIQMPEMDGYEAARRIHAHAPALPIIGQTANSGADELARCRASGMAAQISKPIDPEALVTLIRRHTVERSAGTIDWQALEARFPGKADFIRRLLGVFIQSQTPTVATLRATAACGDIGAIAPIAHPLKSSSGNIMANALMALALRTEQASRQSLPEALTLAEELATALEATLAEVSRHLEA